ncbi:MAG TPA: carboxypeptidase regulatory-like domain-containing protein [Vicinamibacterales bacterium]|nr:carboxypeptidase regulatory-like domain-containing protein [Vicinamibacterales bacterium]
MYVQRLRLGLLGTLALATALPAFGCGGSGGGSSTASSGGPASRPAPPVDAATTGAIAGHVLFQGTAPVNPVIDMGSDPACIAATRGTTPRQSWWVVGPGGGLANAFVYVKSGLGAYSYPEPATPVELDQKNCQYVPHVFGIRVGQPLIIVNSDPTLHNIHARPRVNQEFNTGQPLQGMKTRHVFRAAEVMVPFKCDVHDWMNAYAGVMPDPYFAVSGRDGAFDISGLPPGRYVLAAWHEKLGEQTMNVTIEPTQTRNVTFTFKAK